MEREERIRLEISHNTVNFLVSKLDKLLAGIETKQYEFKSEKEREKVIQEITELVDYRIKEKVIDSNTKIWKILLQIKKLNFSSNRELEKTYLSLLELHYRRRIYPKYIDLKSVKSLYYKAKIKENNMRGGEGVLRRFFRFLTDS